MPRSMRWLIRDRTDNAHPSSSAKPPDSSGGLVYPVRMTARNSRRTAAQPKSDATPTPDPESTPDPEITDPAADAHNAPVPTGEGDDSKSDPETTPDPDATDEADEIDADEADEIDADETDADALSRLTSDQLRDLRDLVNIELSGRNSDTGVY